VHFAAATLWQLFVLLLPLVRCGYGTARFAAAAFLATFLFCSFRSFDAMKFQATLPGRCFPWDFPKPRLERSASYFERRPLVLYIGPLFLIAVPLPRLAVIE
jgi:hypothetical protein